MYHTLNKYITELQQLANKEATEITYDKTKEMFSNMIQELKQSKQVFLHPNLIQLYDDIQDVCIKMQEALS